MSCGKSKKWRGIGRSDVEMKAEEKRRRGGRNRGGLAYGRLMPWNSGTVNTEENRTVRRRKMGAMKRSWAPAKNGVEPTVRLRNASVLGTTAYGEQHLLD
jgi:hypothetical protein